MKNCLIFFTCLASLLLSIASGHPFKDRARTWNSSQGTEIEAKLVTADELTVQLSTLPDKRLIVVRLKDLSESDQKFVERHLIYEEEIQKTVTAPVITYEEYYPNPASRTEENLKSFSRMRLIPMMTSMPNFQDEATRWGLSGQRIGVRFQFIVCADGRVKGVEVLETPDKRLSDKMVPYVEKFRFGRAETMPEEDFVSVVIQPYSLSYR